jgi:hypothetical protein
MMRLHLGCGQRYLKGYVNIDFPASEHSVQDKSVADLHADILTLNYPGYSVQEVRLHHVFEHFPRAIACALVSSWHSWLMQEGILRIEVPDLRRMACIVLRPFASFRMRAIAERHLFGSHEAKWAVHCEGYTPRSLAVLLESYGFDVIRTRKNQWKGTYNFETIARKGRASLSREDCVRITEEYLSNYLLDESESELRLMGIWMEAYKRQLDLSWAGDG